MRTRLPAARRSTDQSLAGFVMFLALSRYSITLQQRRRNTEPLDTLQDRCEQRSWNRNLSHLECYVLGVTDNRRLDLDQLLSQMGGPRLSDVGC